MSCFPRQQLALGSRGVGEGGKGIRKEDSVREQRRVVYKGFNLSPGIRQIQVVILVLAKSN